MGIRTICEHGYPVSACRCSEVHWPVSVVTGCTRDHTGSTRQRIDRWGKPLAEDGSPVVHDPGSPEDTVSAWMTWVEKS